MRGDLIELERDLFGDFNDSVGEITGDLYTVNSDFRGFFDLETKECAEFCNFWLDTVKALSTRPDTNRSFSSLMALLSPASVFIELGWPLFEDGDTSEKNFIWKIIFFKKWNTFNQKCRDRFLIDFFLKYNFSSSKIIHRIRT